MNFTVEDNSIEHEDWFLNISSPNNMSKAVDRSNWPFVHYVNTTTCEYTNITGAANITLNSTTQPYVCGNNRQYGHFLPVHTSLVFIGLVLALIIVILNGILISILLRKSNVTAINVLLSVLGFCDASCAVLLFLPLFIGYVMNELPVDRNRVGFIPGMTYVYVDFPFCVIFDWTFITLADLFHTMSMWMTTFLGLLKALVLMFPLQSRLYVKGKVARILCVFIMLFCIGVYAPIAVTKTFTPAVNNICCFQNDFGNEYRKTFEWIVTMTYLISFSVLITSTVYICLILTIKRTNIGRAENARIQNRNHRAAIIVVLIVIIYLISEAISAFCFFSSTFKNSWDWCIFSFYQYQQIVMLCGFASNFFIYWSMSQELRKQVYNYVCFCFVNKKNTTVTSSTRRTTLR